jgi:hypothetical protein
MTSLEFSSYTHNNQKNQTLKKCTLCNKANMLIRLSNELQEHAAKKGYDAWFCCSCVQIVNFLKPITEN